MFLRGTRCGEVIRSGHHMTKASEEPGQETGCERKRVGSMWQPSVRKDSQGRGAVAVSNLMTGPGAACWSGQRHHLNAEKLTIATLNSNGWI